MQLCSTLILAFLTTVAMNTPATAEHPCYIITKHSLDPDPIPSKINTAALLPISDTIGALLDDDITLCRLQTTTIAPPTLTALRTNTPSTPTNRLWQSISDILADAPYPTVPAFLQKLEATGDKTWWEIDIHPKGSPYKIVALQIDLEDTFACGLQIGEFDIAWIEITKPQSFTPPPSTILSPMLTAVLIKHQITTIPIPPDSIMYSPMKMGLIEDLAKAIISDARTSQDTSVRYLAECIESASAHVDNVGDIALTLSMLTPSESTLRSAKSLVSSHLVKIFATEIPINTFCPDLDGHPDTRAQKTSSLVIFNSSTKPEYLRNGKINIEKVWADVLAEISNESNLTINPSLFTYTDSSAAGVTEYIRLQAPEGQVRRCRLLIKAQIDSHYFSGGKDNETVIISCEEQIGVRHQSYRHWTTYTSDNTSETIAKECMNRIRSRIFKDF
ncbi:hypothetical protein [Rubinisphaera margarita]|uniref:hypothetical protein n=1 Tax=Rubinisphaera margarita TaxID=2909586 RepID=UPI001EE8D492|nr:hypothetical protein [Rubinisphaera margarita]MCG6154185.1 hypothetical protein [Rubinisphaera margarita]